MSHLCGVLSHGDVPGGVAGLTCVLCCPIVKFLDV